MISWKVRLQFGVTKKQGTKWSVFWNFSQLLVSGHIMQWYDLSSSVLLLQPRSSRWWDGYSSYILGHCEDINAFEPFNGWHVMTIWAWYGHHMTETTSPAFDSQWFIYEVEMMVKLGWMTSSQYDINSIWQKSHGIVTSSLILPNSVWKVLPHKCVAQKPFRGWPSLYR